MASESENGVLFVTTNQSYALLLNALHQSVHFMIHHL